MAYEDHLQRDRAESFGSIAAQYDRARPTYPDALIVDLAAGGGVDVLDVGCGTGIASRLLAERGLHVLGVEVDAGMAEVARSRGIAVEVSPFEAWDDAGRSFDLLTSAQAWHWVDPVRGARKAAEVLRPGGRIALFWNIGEVAPPLRDAMDDVYDREAPQLVKRGRRQGDPSGVAALETLPQAGFVDVAQRRYAWEHDYDCDEWIELIGTYSDHHLLPDDQREDLLGGVREVIERFGATVTAQYETLCVLGHRPG